MAKINLKGVRHVTSSEAMWAVQKVVTGQDGLIDDSVAATIASWFQSSGAVGRSFAALASGAPVESYDVVNDVWRTESGAGGHDLTGQDLQALSCLAEWAESKVRS